ncbi:MAG: response regulator transcription factor [Candidatus Marinimicrobia bacterium]|nr:response regulator transcription factor [Candidatus Neomarinimicrobiota bacterium]MBL7109770.1 response regulator transcription factor [Candidatus Neomarinimicrobiota bacterium]
MKILIIEDEVKLADSIAANLKQIGYLPSVCYDGESGLALLKKEEFGCIILDLMLPDIFGAEVCKKIRENGIISTIIVLTAQNELDLKVECLETCSDDYLCKPFEMAELVARIRRSQRRRSQSQSKLILKIDDLELDIRQRKITRAGKKIQLSIKEFELLEFLMRNPNNDISRQILLREVWGVDFDPHSNIVDVYVNYLRNKIDLHNTHPLIHTIRGVGYYFGLR